MIKPSFPARVLMLIIIALSLKLFLGCDPPPPVEMRYNYLNAWAIDNSGRYMQSNFRVDTMYSDAVALKLVLADTLYEYYPMYAQKPRQGLSFSPAMAWSIDLRFIPLNKVLQIRVFTLEDINQQILAGDEITQHILYAAEFSDFELYQDMQAALALLNGIQNRAMASVIMVLTLPAENSVAKFRIEVNLDDGSQLSHITEPFTIITR